MAKLNADSLFGSRINPETGEYYSSSELKDAFLGRTTRVSSSVFRGGTASRGETERGGALMLRPQQTLLDRNQNILIQTNQQSIVGIQEQFNNLQEQLNKINEGLVNIFKLLEKDFSQDELLLAKEEEDKRKAAEEKVRAGRESDLEKKVRSALIAPLRKIEQSMSGLFERITRALGILFLGWLTNQLIESLKADGEGNTEKLEEIKRSILKNLAMAGGVLLAISGGFGLVLGSVLRVTGRLARLAIGLPFKIARGLLSKVPYIGKFFGGKPAAPRVPKGGRVPITGSGGRSTQRGGNWLTNIFRGGAKSGSRAAGGAAAKGGARVGLGALPLIGTALDTYSAIQEAARGNWTGAGLFAAGAATSLLPGLGSLASAGFTAGGIAQSLMYKGDQKTSEEIPSQALPPSTDTQTTPQPVAKPETPAIPSATKNKTPNPPPETPGPSKDALSVNNFFNMPVEPTREIKDLELNPFSTYADNEKSDQKTPPIQPQQIQRPPVQPKNVSALPEAKPNVIYMKTSSQNKKAPSASTRGPLTDVPFIPSSNPDNFYSLYSQLNYNVVM